MSLSECGYMQVRYHSNGSGLSLMSFKDICSVFDGPEEHKSSPVLPVALRIVLWSYKRFPKPEAAA